MSILKKTGVLAGVFIILASVTSCDGNDDYIDSSSSITSYSHYEDDDNDYVDYDDHSDGVVGDNDYDGDIDEEDWEDEWNSYLDDKFDEYGY